MKKALNWRFRAFDKKIRETQWMKEKTGFYGFNLTRICSPLPEEIMGKMEGSKKYWNQESTKTMRTLKLIKAGLLAEKVSLRIVVDCRIQAFTQPLK
jgi:hypothetical protein